MKYLGTLILLASTLLPTQDTAKLYLIAIDGSYDVSIDGARIRVEGKHYISHQVLPGRHTIGYQIGYFGDWTATSLKVIAAQNYYFVFSSAPGRGRMCSQLLPTEGELCLRAIESRNAIEPCLTGGVTVAYPSLQTAMPSNLVPGGPHTNHPR